MDPSPDKLAALEEVVALLDAHRLPYALVGDGAVGLRSGVPRATIDTDLAVATTVDRSRAIRLLAAGGFELRGEFAHTIVRGAVPPKPASKPARSTSCWSGSSACHFWPVSMTISSRLLPSGKS